MELKRVAAKIHEQQGSRLLFDESLLERIFSEGVYPSQGTRPVFSTINQLVTGNLGRVFIEIAWARVNPSEIVMKAGPSSLDLMCNSKEGKDHFFSLPQEWSLEKMRAVKGDNHQALTAVHESCQAILAVFLMHLIPENIFSTSTMGDSSGMVRVDGQERINSPVNLLARLATDLGGLAAEELIFGEENRSTGSESDIEKVTRDKFSCGFRIYPF